MFILELKRVKVITRVFNGLKVLQDFLKLCYKRQRKGYKFINQIIFLKVFYVSNDFSINFSDCLIINYFY